MECSSAGKSGERIALDVAGSNPAIPIIGLSLSCGLEFNPNSPEKVSSGKAATIGGVAAVCKTVPSW
jgi:hypothetical protein